MAGGVLAVLVLGTDVSSEGLQDAMGLMEAREWREEEEEGEGWLV